jgi:hypothetical protein
VLVPGAGSTSRARGVGLRAAARGSVYRWRRGCERSRRGRGSSRWARGFPGRNSGRCGCRCRSPGGVGRPSADLAGVRPWLSARSPQYRRRQRPGRPGRGNRALDARMRALGALRKSAASRWARGRRGSGSAFAPGTGTPEIGGLATWQAQAILRALGGIDFVGM